MVVQVVTSVVTPASSMALTDLATVKSMLGISDVSKDAALTLLITEASAAVAQFCNRPIVQELVKDRIFPERDPYPYQNPNSFAPLQLSRWPVASSPQIVVTENGVTLTYDTDYVLDAPSGRLHRLSPSGFMVPWPSCNITAQYAGGYSPVPADVADACKRVIKARWYSIGRDDRLKQENIPGVIERQWWVSDKGDGNLTPDIVDLLDNYRVPVVA